MNKILYCGSGDEKIAEEFQKRKRFFEEIFNDYIPVVCDDEESGVFNQKQFFKNVKSAFVKFKKKFKLIKYPGTDSHISSDIKSEFLMLFDFYLTKALRNYNKKYWGSSFETSLYLLACEALEMDVEECASSKYSYKIYKKWRKTNAF